MAVPWQKTGNALAIAAQGEVTRQGTLQALGSYKKSKLLDMLEQIKSGGTGFADSLNVGAQVARLAGHQDPEVAATALTCLGLMGPAAQKYEEQLVACAANPEARIRAAAVEALGHLGDSLKDTEVLVTAAQDTDPTVRVKSCQAIAEMEATMLHKAPASLLNDPIAEVQCAAMETIATFISISMEMQSVYCPKVGEVLGEMLAKGRTKAAALDAVAVMGEHAPGSCTSAVVAALGDKDAFTRQSAVAAVGATADAVLAAKGTLPKISELLKSEEVGVRAAAATALATLGEKASSCAEAVAELLQDEGEDISGSAFVMGNGGRRPPPQMRRPKCAAVSALARISSGTYVAKISEALNDANWEVRLSAAEALAQLKTKAAGEASALLGSMEDDAFPVRAMACYALGQVGDVEALPRLAEAFEDPAHSVRLCAVQALGEIGTGAAEEYCHEVFKLMDDPVAQVKAAAVRTMAGLGGPSQSYAGVMATMLGDQDAEVRAAVCEALPRLGAAGKACADELQDLVADPVPAVRQAAVAALDGMGFYVSPFARDFGKGVGVPNDSKAYWRSGSGAEKPAGVLLPGEASFEGLGIQYSDIMEKKQELVGSGKWIEGVL